MTMNAKWEFSRRDALLVAAGGVAAALTAPGAARADTATVSGLVFEDKDGSGKPGPGNPGLAGVLVSNGKDIAVTDADGRYTLPLPEEAVIFVIKPAGFMPPVDPATNLPRFYRLHQPDGSPASLNLTFAGVPPTGPLPPSVDFALRRLDEPTAFEVVLFTDPQPESDVEVDFIREDVIEALAGTKAQFGLTSGDIMFDDLSLYDRYNAIIGTIGLPWWNVGGNHDLNFEAPDRQRSRETFKRVFGPNYYAFFYSQTLFLMLDDVDYLGTDKTRPHGEGVYEGRLDATQLEFVRNVLTHTPPDTLIVMVLHIPLRTYMDMPVHASSIEKASRDELFALFEGRRYTVSFSGHTHTTEHHYFDAADGWKGAAPHHHHVMTAVSRLLVERALRSSRSRVRRQPRRLAERLPYPQRRRQRLQDAVRACQGAERPPDPALDRKPVPRRQSRDQVPVPPRPAQRLTDRPRDARRGDAGRQRLRWRPEDEGDDAHRRQRADRNVAAPDARPVRRGLVRAQRGDQEALDQGRGFLAYLDRAIAPRSRRRRASRRCRGGHRIRRRRERAPRAGGHGVGRSARARPRSLTEWAAPSDFPVLCIFKGLQPGKFSPRSQETETAVKSVITVVIR